MNKILILTYEGDHHSASVKAHFDQHGIEYFEVLTDKLIGNYSLTFDLSKGLFTVADTSRAIELDHTWSIWNRRVRSPDACKRHAY